MAPKSKAESLAPVSVFGSIVESFPLPPPSPLSPSPTQPVQSPKPPLSGPPTLPLPNPPTTHSRYSDHEAILLLSSSSSVRSRVSSSSRLSADSTSVPTTPSLDTAEDEPDPVLPPKDFNSIQSSSVKELISSVQFPGEVDDDEDLPTITPQIDAQTLHRHIRSARSRSHSHKQALQQWKSSPRPASPDIQSILSSTPRPRRGRSFSNLSSSRSKSRSRASQSGSVRRRVSDGVASLDTHSRSFSARPRVSRAFSDRSWAEDEFIANYGAPSLRSSNIDGLPYNHLSDAEEDVIQRLERQLDGDDGSDSDSSLDLHTPLPSLMARHGLLSSRSKLLSNPSRPESKASFTSTTSVMTKSGIIKDARDTPQRRSRHRDGTQLRGGLGLTTGLGWSDSEDEDAPSALTRRVSSLTLSRASSFSSLKTKSSVARHPSSVPRTSSQASLRDLDQSSLRRKSTPTNRSSSRQSQTKSLPSRSRKSGASASEAYTTAFHLPSRVASPPALSSPLAVSLDTIGERKSITSQAGRTRSPSYESGDSAFFEPFRERRSQNEDNSSSSTISVPPPLTPKDDHVSLAKVSSSSHIPSKLPSGGIKRPAPRTNPTGDVRLPRPRALSSGAALDNPTYDPPKDPLPPVPTPVPISAPPTAPRTPRPLQLPLTQGRSSLSAVGGDRESTIPYPRTSTAFTTSAIRESTVLPASLMPSPSSSPPAPNARLYSSTSRPKPRTGTGMVYRSTSISRPANSASDGPASGSRIRAPSQTALPVRQKPIPI